MRLRVGPAWRRELAAFWSYWGRERLVATSAHGCTRVSCPPTNQVFLAHSVRQKEMVLEALRLEREMELVLRAMLEMFWTVTCFSDHRQAVSIGYV